MFAALRRWRRNRRLSRLDYTAATWAPAWSKLPALSGLTEVDAERLRKLAALMLAEKSFEPVAGFTPPPRATQTIALLACLPILNLGPEWLDDFVSIILYPDEFVAEFDHHDEETGVVHRIREARSGESWDIGPLVLSWADVLESADLDGYNVVLHEIAHKLDARDGAVNGKPPLPRDMPARDWSSAFLAAYEDHVRNIERRRPTALDEYAAEAPEEFFAVVTEAFFETPHSLRDTYPSVYQQLATFYRQDPSTRLPRVP
ncbi:MAG: zinc-dependent peptidase [Thiotrichales bacterium]